MKGTGTSTPATGLTVAHELTHALQDQHFDLGGYDRAGCATTHAPDARCTR